MSSTETDAAGEKEMTRFLRHIAGGRVRMAPVGAQTMVARREGSGPREFPRHLVYAALRHGLVRRSGDEYELDPAGRAWLKRSLVEGGAQPYAAQHRDPETATVTIDRVSARVTRNLAESPLAALMRMKTKDGRAFLADDAFNAGERLRLDFTRGQLQPRVSANWEAGVAAGSHRSANGTAEISDAALAARQRVDRALEAVGPELSGVLIDVCCFLKGIETVERERQWPARSGKLMLKTALLALARHYAPPRRDPPRRSTHRWGAPDYRPEIGVRQS